MMASIRVLVVLLNYRTPDITLRAAGAVLADLPDPSFIRTLFNQMARTPRAGFAASHSRVEGGTAHVSAVPFPTIAGEFKGAIRFGPVSHLMRRVIVAPHLPDTTVQIDWSFVAWAVRLAGSAFHAARCALTGRRLQDTANISHDFAGHGLGLPMVSRAIPSRRFATEDRS